MEEMQDEQGTQTTLDRIYSGVRKTEKFCNEECLAFKKPLLILGIFERVGSNWLLETLNQHVHTHNEPFKQQLGQDSVYSTLSPQLQNVSESSSSLQEPFLLYWLETFVNTKYGTTNHAVKETNLFFALKNFLRLFPDSPVLILKREPIGIFSSFVDQDLFTRWKYQERYEKLKPVSEMKEWGKFRFVFDENEVVSSLTILTRMLFLNTLLVADQLDGRLHTQLAYEASVKDRSETLHFLSTEVFPGINFSDEPNEAVNTFEISQGTFSTRRSKSTLESYLDLKDTQNVSTELYRLFAIARTKFEPATVERASSFLSFDKSHYAIAGRRHLSVSSSPLEKPSRPAPEEFIADQNKDIEWRNKLVTNDEYCSFLNKLVRSGISNLLDGGQIFFNENMAHERGGRIHFDRSLQIYQVSSGYENHPVYWVTWIGATAFARHKGLDLPQRAEINALVQNAKVPFSTINAGHKFDDVQPINSENYTPEEINDIVGNLAVWCSDGQKQLPNDPQSATRYIYGTAWNRPATLREITKDHSRPLTGNSRAIGIRLIKDKTRQEISFTELVEKLQMISSLLHKKKSSSLREKDEAIITLLNP